MIKIEFNNLCKSKNPLMNDYQSLIVLYVAKFSKLIIQLVTVFCQNKYCNVINTTMHLRALKCRFVYKVFGY